MGVKNDTRQKTKRAFPPSETPFSEKHDWLFSCLIALIADFFFF